VRLIELLKSADSLSNQLRAKGLCLPARTAEGQLLLTTLNTADHILGLYRGTRCIWVEEDYSLCELFGLDLKRLERDDSYYSETRVMNFALELLRNGSIQRLRTCQECKKWYYAMADHQKHCSSKCRQRLASHDRKFHQRRREYMRGYRLREQERSRRAQRIARGTK
jgi:hypothetical protein